MILETILQRYPELVTMRGNMPDEVIEREVSELAIEYETWRPAAQTCIPVARLDQVFPADIEHGRITLESFLGQWGNVTIEEVGKICLVISWLKPKWTFEFGTYN